MMHEEIPIFEIHPRNVWDIVLSSATELDRFDKYRSDLAYRSFSPSRIERVIETGTDRDVNSLMWELRGLGYDPRDVLWANSEKMIRSTSASHWAGEPSCIDGLWTVSVYDSYKLTYISGSMNGFLRNNTFPIAILKIFLSDLVEKEGYDLDARRSLEAYAVFRKTKPLLEFGTENGFF